jgi:hypothetical protein
LEFIRLLLKSLPIGKEGSWRRLFQSPRMPLLKVGKSFDSVLIANECLDNMIKYGEPGVLCKLDIKKVYDHVNWEFLLYLLRMCGFEEKLCSWIAHCISSVCFSILVSGNPSSFVSSSYGLRQRNHLSPFLFVIVMEALSKILSATVDEVFSQTFLWDLGTLVWLTYLSHMLFANDTLIFCGPILITFATCVLYFYVLKLSQI